MDQRGIVSIDITVDGQSFSFHMPMNGKSTYSQALKAALEIASGIQEFIKEMESKAATPENPEIVTDKE